MCTCEDHVGCKCSQHSQNPYHVCMDFRCTMFLKGREFLLQPEALNHLAIGLLTHAPQLPTKIMTCLCSFPSPFEMSE